MKTKIKNELFKIESLTDMFNEMVSGKECLIPLSGGGIWTGKILGIEKDEQKHTWIIKVERSVIFGKNKTIIEELTWIGL